MKGLIHNATMQRALAFAVPFLFILPAAAQVPVDESGNPIGSYQAEAPQSGDAVPGTMLGAAELEALVGPVALYPDDLLAIVLPASTYPLEIVQAARFLEALEDDASLEPDESWDDSVVALLNYPDVVRMMDEDIDWTWRLGEAVLTQQSEVIAAVEAFRDRAYAAGNLETDDYQKVQYDDDGVLEIVPVNEEIIYVPYYEPAEVVVYQPRRVYYYYPDPCPVYYYPYPAGYRFRSGYFWGVTTAFSIGWSNHYLHVYHPSYWGHPYYGRYYYGHFYRRPSISIYNNWYVNNSYRTPRYRYRDGDYWRPRHRSGSRPVETRVRNEHYVPNRRNSRTEYTTSRRNPVDVRSDGRMDLQLRERDGRRTQADTGQRDRGTRSITGSRPVTGSRTGESRQDGNRASTRTVDTAARTTDRRGTAVGITRNSIGTGRTTDRASTGGHTSRRSEPVIRNNTGSTERSSSRRIDADRPTIRRTTPPRTLEQAPARRSAGETRSTGPAPRMNATPAVQPRMPSAPRSDSRSTSRREGAASGNRRSGSSRSRVRNNNQD